MRILSIISTINPEGGGPIEVIAKIDRELTRLGHVHETLSLDDPNENFIKNYPGKLYALGPSNAGNYMYTPKLVPWLQQNASKYDALIVNGLWQYHSFGVWRALAGFKIPYFIFPHGMLDPWFKRRFRLKHLKKWLYWPWAEYRVLRDATAVIFTCEEERLLARDSFWIYRCKEVVMMLGISSPPATSDELSSLFLSKYPSLIGKRIFLFLGRIHEKKGCNLLLDAFAQVANKNQDFHLVMAGPDQEGLKSELKKQAAKLGISSRITWPGMLVGDQKWGAFFASEVFCLPSHQENFGIVVAEALACGKPVLISNKVNIWREIEIDGAGIVSDDTSSATAKSLFDWIALTPTTRLIMQESAKRCFKTRFQSDVMVQNLLKIIQPTLN